MPRVFFPGVGVIGTRASASPAPATEAEGNNTVEPSSQASNSDMMASSLHHEAGRIVDETLARIRERPRTRRRRITRTPEMTLQGITKQSIRRLARRGGVARISGLMYEETRGVLKTYLENVIKDAVTYTDHARRKTVTAADVVHAMRRQGRVLYGFDNAGTE